MAAAAQGLWTEHQPAGEIKKYILSFCLTFDSNYFQAIQALFFYKKNESKMFKSSLSMFLGLLVRCDWIGFVNTHFVIRKEIVFAAKKNNKNNKKKSFLT